MSAAGKGTVFWGTPAIAAECMRALHAAGEELVGVISQPDKPVGRARRLAAPPVKALALELGIECVQPVKLRTSELAHWLRRRAPYACIVVAYGKIIPSELLEIPTCFLNLHFSLCPPTAAPHPSSAHSSTAAQTPASRCNTWLPSWIPVM